MTPVAPVWKRNGVQPGPKPNLEKVYRPNTEKILRTSTPPDATRLIEVELWTELVRTSETFAKPILCYDVDDDREGRLFYVRDGLVNYVYLHADRPASGWMPYVVATPPRAPSVGQNERRSSPIDQPPVSASSHLTPLEGPVAFPLPAGPSWTPVTYEDLLARTRSVLQEIKSQTLPTPVAMTVVGHLRLTLQSVRIGRLDFARSELIRAQALTAKLAHMGNAMPPLSRGTQMEHSAAGRPSVNQVSVVIPVLNEITTLPRLVACLDQYCEQNPSISFNEVIFVDDGSTDGTLDFLSALSNRGKKYTVRLLLRGTRHGPASAELAGCKVASNEWILKMDADGQHLIELLPALASCRRTDTDLVVASRYIEGGGNRWEPRRGVISRSARFLAYVLVPRSRKVADPVSGFLFLRRGLVSQLKEEVPWYKLLLYILSVHDDLRIGEVPFVMGDRVAGESKVADRSARYIVRYLLELVTYWRVSHESKLQAAGKAPRAEGPIVLT
jgi:Glycosyl transferase family 2